MGATVGQAPSRNDVAEAGAVGVVTGEDRELRLVVVEDQLRECRALQVVGGRGAEVVAAGRAAGDRELGRGVRARALDDPVRLDLVDDAERGRRRCRARGSTSTLSEVSSVSSELDATSALVPSSACLSTTGLPFTPPAALISSTAIVDRRVQRLDRWPRDRRTAAGARRARAGRRRCPDRCSWAAVVLDPPDFVPLFLSLPHADATSAIVATSDIAKIVLVLAMCVSPKREPKSAAPNRSPVCRKHR